MRVGRVKNILLVDDDLDLCRLLSDYLETEGFTCLCFHDGQTGLEAAVSRPADFELLVLDVMLPRKNGFEVLAAIRQQGIRLPIIMLTAKGDSVDLILGLEMGADDYLPKPFNPRELLARMRAIIRRVSEKPDLSSPNKPDVLNIDGFELHEKSLQAAYLGRALNLTPVEFRVLWALLGSPGHIVSRNILFKEALGRSGQAFDRSLDMHISRLRKKIWPAADGLDRLKSIRGEGYIYVPSEERLI